MFNYIVTIHNSEQHLRYVLEGIFKVKSHESRVYCVLDGCTDGGEAICDEYPEFEQIVTSDVRETKAITTALSQIPQDINTINFILQDDVVLQDTQTEDKIKDIFSKYNVGVLGMRHGGNFEDDVLFNGKHASEVDLIQNEFQPPLPGVPVLKEGHITERTFVYKSPICISGKVVMKLGGYDERFEPIAHDDTEYCIRAIKEGFKNYVYALRLMQPAHWGGTRRFPQTHSDNFPMHHAHMNLLRQLYRDDISYLAKNKPSLEEIKL